MEIDPKTLAHHKRYGLMISLIQPRPIAWVSTINAEGRPNLAPFSYFTGVSSKPCTVCFAPANNPGGAPKDTLANIEETKAFVVNIATESTDRKMVQSSAEYPRGVSEFEEAGLTPAPCTIVRPPRVKESPVSLECELRQVVKISKGPGGGNLVIGEVVHIHIDDAIWKDGKVSHEDLKPLGRLEGNWYARVSDDYEIPRPELPK